MWKLVESESRGDLIAPRSYCPHCREQIRPFHLVPLAGFFMLGGKCAACKMRIPLRYPVVELLGALAAVFALVLFGPGVTAICAAVFFWFLIALGFIDTQTGYLPDALTLPLIAAGLIANGFGLFVAWPGAAIGAGAGYLVFVAIAELFVRARGVEGLGRGDAKLLAALGAWLGWLALAPIVFSGALLALASIAMLRFSGRRIANDTPVPFGPALAAAGALAMIAHGLDWPSYYWR